MILHCSSMSGMQTNMFVHIFTYCHIINPSLIPHWHTTPSLYNCTGCLPNPSPTPVRVQLKPCLTHASAKGPTQTNRRPKEPSTRQLKQMTTTTTRTSQAMNKKQWMGWRMRTTPQHWEVVDEGMPWKKAPLEGMLGTIIVNRALISLCFVFMITYCFYRKTAHNWARDNMEQSPQRYAGHNCYNHALISFFFCFFFFPTTYLVFTGKPPTIRLAMTGNHPHKGMPGTIIVIVPYIFFFFSNTYCLLTGKLSMFGLMMTWNHPHKGT